MGMDEVGFGILMLIFSGMIVFYAVLMMLTKDYNLLPRHAAIAVKPKDPKAYTFQLGKGMLVVALAPALAGIISFANAAAGMIVLPCAVIASIFVVVKIMKKVS